MARRRLYGTESSTVVWPPVGADVYVKWNWEDEWQFLPFLTPVNATEAAAPSVGQATFRYDFGPVYYPEVGDFDDWLYYTINGAFVAVVVYDYYGEALLWVGIIDMETVRPFGDDTVPAGEQIFTAFSLEHMLDRRPIMGAYTTAGYIDTPMRFNKRRGRGAADFGNKDTFDNVFGEDGIAWTNLDIADYVVDNFAPASIEWIGVGQTLGLTSVAEEMSLDGLTVFEALNRLIDRRRGLSWCCVTTGDGPVYIYVFSMSPFSFGMEGAIIEANENQVIVDFTGYRNVQPVITFNNLATFDTIEVRGGPITTTMSLSYMDGTLQEGWTPEAQADYEAGSTDPEADVEDHDAARGAEIYDAVFSKHRLVDDWAGVSGDGEGTSELVNAIPGYWADGTPDEALLGTFFRPDKVFMRTLPIAVEGTDSDAPEFRRALVVALVDVEGTYDPADEDTPDERVWAYVDKLRDLGSDFESLGVGIGDRDLSVIVRGRPAHLFAKFRVGEDFDAMTATPPQVDYLTMIATVQMATDMRIRATWITPGLRATGRTKLIEDPDAQAWYVVPGTVIDVQDGGLIRHAGGWERDDSPRLRQKAVLAAAWYSVQRAQLEYTLETLGIGMPVGTMIAGVVGPEGYTEIGTVVTQRQWSFLPNGECRTVVTTGHAEIDFGGAM